MHGPLRDGRNRAIFENSILVVDSVFQWLPSVYANFLSRGSILGLLRFHGILLRLDALRSIKDDTMKEVLGHASYGNLFGIIWVRWRVLFVLLKLDISSSVPAMRAHLAS